MALASLVVSTPSVENSQRLWVGLVLLRRVVVLGAPLDDTLAVTRVVHGHRRVRPTGARLVVRHQHAEEAVAAIRLRAEIGAGRLQGVEREVLADLLTEGDGRYQ